MRRQPQCNMQIKLHESVPCCSRIHCHGLCHTFPLTTAHYSAHAVFAQVPFLSRECEAVHGQAVVLEALQALYNICFFHKRVHLEVAASSGIVPHLCRYGGSRSWAKPRFRLCPGFLPFTKQKPACSCCL